MLFSLRKKQNMIILKFIFVKQHKYDASFPTHVGEIILKLWKDLQESNSVEF